ncbi:hypothetical protein KC19_10G131800 [Ceratodon purpureus]|uniref:Uncharacterized protein n=1 Tax=Ceratodon purpureus TaxID=3225 RepID=A0A8T0GLH6_CERPU|nr:hypothetical protein KC19_10G131800 [Ceratodon purpureus]
MDVPFEGLLGLLQVKNMDPLMDSTSPVNPSVLEPCRFALDIQIDCFKKALEIISSNLKRSTEWELESFRKRESFRKQLEFSEITARKMAEWARNIFLELRNEECIMRKCAQVYAWVSALSFLSLIYRYLAGCVSRGGTKTHSSGALEFRSTYVSIVLFQGSYVWIKFRDGVAGRITGYRRNKLSGTIKPSEARYTPPRGSGNHNYIYLGLCKNDEEVYFKKHIAASFYAKDYTKSYNLPLNFDGVRFGFNPCRFDFDDCPSFIIPSMSTEEEQSLSVAEKRAWVKDRVKDIYEVIKVWRIMYGPSNLDIDEQIRVDDHSTPQAEIFAPSSEALPLIPSDTETLPKELAPLPRCASADFGKFLEDMILDSSEDISDLPNPEPSEDLQDIHVQDMGISTTLGNQCGYSESLGTEPVGTSYSELGLLNVVIESSEAAVNSDDMVAGIPKVDAPHDSEAVSEFPVMSPDSTLQQHSGKMAALSDMVKPSAVQHSPGNSTSDLLALISLYKQQLLEKDNTIVELKRRENERLRGASHGM